MLAAAILLFSARGASAQTVTQAGTWTASPFLGVSFGTSNNLDSSLGLGVGVGYDLTRNLGFEGEFGHVFDVQGDSDNIDWSITNFSGNVLYHFDLRGPVTPYATFGLGWERSSVDVENPDPAALYPASSTEVAYNFGGGIKYRFSDNLLARADLRRFQSNDLAPDHWRLYGGLTFELAKR
jgi:opacity protein-like surface antigen